MNRQQVFDFHQPERLSWDDFVESDENRDVIAYLSQWKLWNVRSLVIYGSAGVGKTHVATLWAQSSNAVQICSDNFFHSPRELFEIESNFVIDGFDDFLQIQNYNWLFDFINILNEKGRFLVITSRTSPSSWDISLLDLRSRLLLIPALKIQDPSDNLLFYIAKKLAKDQGIIISDDCVNYILSMITRDVRTVRETINTLNKLSLEQKQSINLSFVRKYLHTL